MGVFSRDLLEVAGNLPRRAAAPEQAGIFAGDNPASYNASDPIRLWIIQVIVIIGMTQILALILGRIRQPRVIAEVIGGVILGPSVMGRIPNFTNTIFPPDSIPLLNLTATIGLVLFLFLVGLEVDVSTVKKNMRASMLISVAGLILPLGLGAALAVPIYHQFIDENVNFGYFILFVAVAVGITAFPVLCRILTELKLLDTTVGVVTLAAGVGNDVVGWILLALTVALVNAGNGLTALWVLLTAVGYVIFLLVPVRLGFRWLARRSGSLENGQPTAMMMTVTLGLVFVSAFFTDIIGIHAIFGGFLAGLIIPKDNGFAIALVEKLEDLVSILLLPLYFAFSGLRTNLGLLDNGITWGYVVLICVVAFFSKFLGCAVAARFSGFNLRESGAIGALMSCKGLVELIVLNVGLTAGILDTRTFSMFVLHALVLTFMTTPLTILLYPARVRVHAGLAHDKTPGSSPEDASEKKGGAQELFKTRFAVVVDKIEQLSAVMTLTQMLQPLKFGSASGTASSADEDEKASAAPPGLPYRASKSSAPKQISVDALRLIELTDRTSAVLKSQSADALVHTDPVLSVIRTFGYLNRMVVSTALSVIGYDEFPSHVASHVRVTSAQMVIVPWSSSSLNEESINDASPGVSTPVVGSTNPFEGLFGAKTSGREHSSAVVHTQFVRKVFAGSAADVALFVDRGLPQSLDVQGGSHIFLPFLGGPDDRLALSFVVQLCMNPNTTATVVRYTKTDNNLSPINSIEEAKAEHILHGTVASVHNTVFPDTVYGAQNTQTRLASDTADNILWDRLTDNQDRDIAIALNRITFLQQSTPTILTSALAAASTTISEQSQHHSRVIIAVGRSRRMAVESLGPELKGVCSERNISIGSELPKTLGDLGAVFAVTNSNTSLLVLQAS